MIYKIQVWGIVLQKMGPPSLWLNQNPCTHPTISLIIILELVSINNTNIGIP